MAILRYLRRRGDECPAELCIKVSDGNLGVEGCEPRLMLRCLVLPLAIGSCMSCFNFHLRCPIDLAGCNSMYLDELVPMSPDDRPGRVPRPMDLILVPLQANQPPTRHAHA